MPRALAYLTVFVASACIMIVELVAGRMIAPVLGVSLYSWTTIIGVILGGMGLGNYLGGLIADRYPTRRTLATLLLLGSLVTLSIVITIRIAGLFHSMPPEWPIVLRFILSVGAVFFAPTCILGMITPVVIKLSLDDLSRAGGTVGALQAIGLVGSIVGTFETGFFLISTFGTRLLIVLVAAALASLGLVVAWKDSGKREAGMLVLFASVLGVIILGNRLGPPCARESNYFCINIQTLSAETRPVKLLFLDRLLHAQWSPAEPLELFYDYEKSYAIVTEQLARRQAAFDAFFIGGGGYVFPYYLTQVYPRARVVVAEIDPAVTETARREFALSLNPPVEIHDMDARLYLATADARRQFDVVYGDAFNDLSVPYHLTTREFAQLVKARLKPGGVYMANIIDAPRHGHFFRAFIGTVREVFAHVRVLGVERFPEVRGQLTVVVAASDAEMRADELRSIAAQLGLFGGSFAVMPDAYLETYLKQASPLVLSDDFVPTDNLLAPVFDEN